MRIIICLAIFLSSISISMGQGLNKKSSHLPCLDKGFPVMVHLSSDSMTRQPYLDPSDVDNLLEKVSRFFEPICMSFSACEINVIENYTFHNLVDERRYRELQVLHGKPNRINIFILGSIPDATCGHSTFDGINQEKGEYIYLETDECDDSLEGQLAHHLGHYFGLLDTYFGDDIEIVDDSNCAITGDNICDTPTDPFGEYNGAAGDYKDILPEDVDMDEFLRDCEFIHELLDPNGDYYQPQVGNIMSAYPCRCSFTNGQLLKVIENYNSATHRPY